MTVRNKIFTASLSIVMLTACSSFQNNDDLDLSGDSVGNELTEEELGSDVAEAENEFNEAETSTTANEPAVDPDLAEDVFNEDLDSNQKQAAAATPAPPPEPEQAPAPEANEPPPVADNSQSESSQQIDITNIRYLADQGGRVVIDTNAPATYRTREVANQNQMVIEIANARLPAKLKRPFITKDFKQPIASINAYQDNGSTTARVVVQFREPTTADVAQEGGRLTLVASGSSSMGGGADQVAESEDSEGMTVSAKTSSKSSKAIDNFDDDRFYGKPINIEVRETNIRDVFTLIAEQSGANIVVSDDVKGNVTIKLRQIPWDQALSIIMKTKSLGYVRQGSVLRIAPIDQLQKETDDLKKIQDAQKLALPLRVKVIPVNYAKVTDLANQVKDFLSTRGKVVADSRTSSLIITDITENLDRTTNLVKALDVPPQQVLIEGKVVEATDNLAKSLGINWNLSGDTYYKNGAAISPNLNITPGALPTTGLGLNISAGTMKYLGDLSASLGLAEAHAQAKVLSSPRVVTLNNEQANIKQVTQIVIQKESINNGVQSFTPEYKSVELSLEVTPQVTANTDVLLQISLKREFAAAADAGQAPPIESREAKTKVLVPSGQTAVVGGIYQNDETSSDNGVPVIKDVPVVGWLFKNKSSTNIKRELLLFLTPRILSRNKTPARNGTEL